MNNEPVGTVIETEEIYGHTFKKRTVSTVKWLENVEVGTKLYTHPVKQLSDEEIYELWIDAKQTALNTKGGIVELCFARAIIKEMNNG